MKSYFPSVFGVILGHRITGLDLTAEAQDFPKENYF